MKHRKKLLAASFMTAAVAAGLATASILGSSVPGALTESQTVQADPSTMVDTARSVSLIDQGKAALCKTTISGVSYYANPTAYVGGQWYLGLSALTLGKALATNKAVFDTAGSALQLTTITGKKYCASTSRWPSGQWAAAFSALADGRAFLVANPTKDGPSIKVLP